MSQVGPHASKTSDVLGATCNVFVLVPGSSVTAILRKLKQQSRESVEDKRPKLLKALREVSATLPHYTASQNVAVFSKSPQAAISTALRMHSFPSISEVLWMFEHGRVCLLCSLVTFIWSCTGIFRAGVSFHHFTQNAFVSQKREWNTWLDLFTLFSGFHSASVVPDAPIWCL